MMRLYLVRHAEALEPSPTHWPDDRLRPLSSQGMRALRKAAPAIARLTGPVERVLASPFVRTVQTAQLLERAGWPHAVELAELAPDEPAAGVLAAVRRYEVERVAIVGHEPNLKALLSLALAGDAARLDCRFEKGAAACLKFASAVRAGAARLEWLIRPRTLRALAKG